MRIHDLLTHKAEHPKDARWTVLTSTGVTYCGTLRVIAINYSTIRVLQLNRPREVLVALEHIVAIYRD